LKQTNENESNKREIENIDLAQSLEKLMKETNTTNTNTNKTNMNANKKKQEPTDEIDMEDEITNDLLKQLEDLDLENIQSTLNSKKQQTQNNNNLNNNNETNNNQETKKVENEEKESLAYTKDLE